MTGPETLGLWLVQQRVISREQLNAALNRQRACGRMLGSCLIEQGQIAPDVLLRALSTLLGIPYVAPGMLSQVSPAAVSLVRPELAAVLHLVPYKVEGRQLSLALADCRALAHLATVDWGGAELLPAIALESEVDAAMQRAYGRQLPALRPDELEAYRQSARPRPIHIPAPVSEPVLLTKRKRPMQVRPVTTPAPPILGPPPAAKTNEPTKPVQAAPPPTARAVQQPTRNKEESPPAQVVEPQPLASAIDALYQASERALLSCALASACLEHFETVVVLEVQAEKLQVRVCTGAKVERRAVVAEAVPALWSGLQTGLIVFGEAAEDEVTAELCEVFEIAPHRRALLACLQTQQQHPALVLYAGTSDDEPSQQALEEVEILLKETETALSLLTLRAGAPIPIP